MSDALLSPRPYRPTAYDNHAALESLERKYKLEAQGYDFDWLAKHVATSPLTSILFRDPNHEKRR